MGTYMIPIQTAFLIFPFLSFLFTLPYMFFQYHKYGSVPILRSIIVYSFILYLTNVYFLVILPLPPIEEVLALTTPTTQLVPFRFIRDFLRETNFVWNDPSTYLSTLLTPACYQVLYNLAMTIPFGIYLRYYFKKSFSKTLFYTFLLSLFFELTQLSGLYGIYPRGYRLFDIDDLFINTLGGVIGYIITPLFVSFLPSRDKLDEIAYKKGEKISSFRRIFAFIVDWIFVTLLIFVLGIFVKKEVSIYSISYLIAIFLYFVILPTITGGYTIGKKFMNMKITKEDGSKPKIYHYIIRYFGLYYVLIFLPDILNILSQPIRNLPSILLPFGVAATLFTFLIYFVFLFQVIRSPFKNRPLLYEKWSRTENRSTISFKKEEKKEELEEENKED